MLCYQKKNYMFREEIDIKLTLKKFKRIVNFRKPKEKLIRGRTSIITDLIGLRFSTSHLKAGSTQKMINISHHITQDHAYNN